jgi:ESS family glutamate:Na+ symporter
MNLSPLASLLLAVAVLLAGTWINRRVGVLSRYNIPDPITGGLVFAAIASLAIAVAGWKVGIDQTIKPTLLLMFFAGVGLSSDLRQLKAGGKALVIFLIVLLPYVLAQNLVGVGMTQVLDLHPIFGLVAGSITLVGGHGTGAAYATRFAEINNLQAVMELSMTVATIGLILGGIVGGPVAQFLISRHNLASSTSTVAQTEARVAAKDPITTTGFIAVLAGILAAVMAGSWLGEKFAGAPITLPTFLWCMLIGVAIRNVLPLVGPTTDDRAADLISGVSLSLFLVMTMMALDLVHIAQSAGPFVAIVLVQVVVIVLYAVFVCFRAMGKDYEAATTSAAFIGFCMGSTATAMANMQAITAKYGPAPKSFLIVPLAGAFFVDLMNAIVLTLLLAIPFVGGG